MSYFQAIRRLKDSQFYINEITKQFAIWKATQDQVDNPQFKAYSRATTNRLVFREIAASPVQRDAEFYQPGIPQEPDGSTVMLLLNFDHELIDRSGKKNNGIFEFTNDQLLFADGRDAGFSFAVNFNPLSNDTYDKIWVPFSNTTQIVYDTPVGFSIFTRIMPTVITPIGQTASPTPMTNRVSYQGGPVHNKVRAEIINVYWGTQWSSGDHATRRTQMNQAMDAINNGDHWKGL